jgi:thiol-disulfide isomerase/thioredoxin
MMTKWKAVAFSILLALLAACSKPAEAPQIKEAASTPAKNVASEAKPDAVTSKVAPGSDIKIITTDELKAMIQSNTGKPVVVNFWATWCEPCIAEMPQLAAFAEAFTPKGAVFISVSVDHPDTIEGSVKPFVRDKKIPFDVAVIRATDPDEVGEALELADWSGAVPVTLVYGRDGVLVKQWSKEVTQEILAEAVTPLL